MTTCRIKGCERKKQTHGLCGMHYQRQRRWGDPRPDIPAHQNRGRPYKDAVPDDVAVLRAVTGDSPPHLLPAERARAVETLAGRGLSSVQIAARLGCSPRTVERWRRTLRAVAS